MTNFRSIILVTMFQLFKTCTFLLLFLIASLAQAQNPSYVRSIEPQAAGIFPGADSVLWNLITGSGAQYLIMDGGLDAFVIRRFDLNGDNVWSKNIQHPDLDLDHDFIQNNRFAFYSDLDEGLFFCAPAEPILMGDSIGIDTLDMGILVFHLDDQGNQDLCVRIDHRVIDNVSDLIGGISLNIPKLVAHEDGSFHIVHLEQASLGRYIYQLIRFDQNWQYDHAFNYHLPSHPSDSARYFDFGQFNRFIRDGSGGLYLAQWNTGLRHFDPTGMNDWSSTIGFSNTSGISNSSWSSVVRPTLNPFNGYMTIRTTSQQSSFNRDYVIQLDANGVISRADGFTQPSILQLHNGSMYDVVHTDMDEFLLMYNGGHSSLAPSKAAVFAHLDANLTVTEFEVLKGITPNHEYLRWHGHTGNSVFRCWLCW